MNFKIIISRKIPKDKIFLLSEKVGKAFGFVENFPKVIIHPEFEKAFDKLLEEEACKCGVLIGLKGEK